MTTQKQRDANRRNAQNSTGPKTVSGRLRSKVNALTHGLTAAQITLHDENPAEFAAYHGGFVETFAPVGAHEEQLVERLAFCGWRLRRVYRYEASIFASEKLGAGRDFVNSESEHADRSEAVLSTPEDSGLSETEIAELRKVIRGQREFAFGLSEIHKRIEISRFDDVGSLFQRLTPKPDVIGGILRYETSIERSYYRALYSLGHAQARRKGEMVTAPFAVGIGREN